MDCHWFSENSVPFTADNLNCKCSNFPSNNTKLISLCMWLFARYTIFWKFHCLFFLLLQKTIFNWLNQYVCILSWREKKASHFQLLTFIWYTENGFIRNCCISFVEILPEITEIFSFLLLRVYSISYERKKSNISHEENTQRFYWEHGRKNHSDRWNGMSRDFCTLVVRSAKFYHLLKMQIS